VEWAAAMKNGHLFQTEAWVALQSTLWRTLSYPLSALNLTRKQWNWIMAPAIANILNALGICRNFPRSLVFAPIQYLGLGIIHLHMIQEISRLTDLITHTADMTITGSLYRASLEVFLIEMGISTDLDSIPFDKTHFLSSDALIKSSWEFFCSYKIT
jgi:hypothetical protein